jgi:hypothetical protein
MRVAIACQGGGSHTAFTAGVLKQILNSSILWASNLQNFVKMPVISPYDNYFSVSALEEFKKMLQRRVDLGKIEVQPEGSYPVLLVGAVDVLSGEFRAFNSRSDRKKQVARNGVAWTVRAVTGDKPEDWVEGVVEAAFRGGKIKALRLGDGTRPR